jgi:hypothetical protein
MPRFACTCIPLAAAPLALALASGQALAAEVPTIGVVGVHQISMDEARQLAASQGLVAAIEAGGRWDGLGPGEIAAAVAGRESVILEEGLLSAARLSLQSGKNAYNQASPEDAVAQLEQAIEGYRDVFSGAFVVEELWEAWVYLGTSHLQRDPPDEVAARKAFASALALLPHRPLNPALYPPHVIELFQAVQADQARHGVKLELTVAGDGPATVWIDGVERGQTPLTVPDVLPGEHFVVARADRREAFARLDVPMPGVVEGEGAPAPVVQQVPLALGAPVLGEPAASPLGRANQTAALYGALGRRSEGVDYMLVTGVHDGSLSLQLMRVATGTFSKAVELPLAGDAGEAAVRAVPLMLSAIQPDGSFTATAPAPAPLDLGANPLLALLLDRHVQPVQPVVDVGDGGGTGGSAGGGKVKVGVVLGIVGGVVAAGVAGTGGYLLLSDGQGPGTNPGTGPNQGAIRIQF